MRYFFGLMCLAAVGPGALRADPPALDGSWRVLLAHRSDADALDDPVLRDSVVTIKGDRLEWKSADGKVSHFAATIVIREAKEKGALNELDLQPVGGKADKPLPGIYDLYLPDYLKISFHETTRPKGYSCGRQSTFFLLERIKPGSPRPTRTTGKDAELLLGTWTMLTSLDDASDKIRPGPYSGHVCVITKTRIEWKATSKSPTPSVGADYTIDPTKSPRAIDFRNTKGGNPAPPEDGYLPAIYEFIDDDTLKVCYPESGFKAGTPPQDRLRPTRFYSDGDRNLWVMKRQPTVASKEPVKP